MGLGGRCLPKPALGEVGLDDGLRCWQCDRSDPWRTKGLAGEVGDKVNGDPEGRGDGGIGDNAGRAMQRPAPVPGGAELPDWLGCPLV